MFDLIWLIIMAALLVGAVAIVIVAVWRAINSPPAVDPERLARERGWTYAEGQGRNWEITAGGDAWRLAFRINYSSHSKNIKDGETVWTARADVPPDQAVFLSAQPPAWMRGETVFKFIQQFARLGGGELSGLMTQASIVSVGDAAFDAKYGVATTDPNLARRCLDAHARRDIQAFVDQTGRVPRLTWSPGQLTVRLPREVTEEATLEAMIGLGKALAGRGARPS